MSRLISRAEAWEKAYEAFQNVNFAAFDFDTIKQSMVDYIRLYFPENFNDYIESDEFIAQLELFAYVGELLAYRVDLMAHENFLPTAQRKQNILRLAKLISYKPSRNVAARGLVKFTSITTSEQVFDSNGNNLANVKITWNDPNNPNWKEQFLLVMNRVLQQEFGTVMPNDRVQVDNVLFELYSLNNDPISNGVIPYSVSVSGKSYPMELVPSGLNSFGPLEKRPEVNSNFTILYASDGLGDASDTTGFFAFTKQGSLQVIQQTYDGITPNQTTDLGVTNVNETDLWVNNVDPTTREILDDGSVKNQRSGEWMEVDISHAQNVVFNTNSVRNKYELETLENDDVRVIFGDGEFANIPTGAFDIWVRSSANENVVIPQNTIVNRRATFTYTDVNSLTQTFNFTYSLISTLQNAASSEDIEHIRRMAPAVYYTQDRMVNGQDYNTFLLQDPTILKVRSFNRTFAGDSKYIAWHDPRESYEDVKLFGDDLLLYYKESTTSFQVPNITGTELLTNDIEPLLSTLDVFLKISLIDPHNTRRSFTGVEKDAILDILDPQLPNPPLPANELVYIFHGEQTPGSGIWWNAVRQSVGLPVGFTTDDVVFTAIRDINDVWTVTYSKLRMIVESNTTNFWNTNDGNSIVSFDTLNSQQDSITILKANENRDRTQLMSGNIDFTILGQENGDDGLPNVHQLHVVPPDGNGDGIPDDVTLSEVINPRVTVDPITATTVTLPIYYIKGEGDVLATDNAGTMVWVEDSSASAGDVTNVVEITSNTPINTAIVAVVTGLNGSFAIATDLTSIFVPGFTFSVVGSTGNNGNYTVQSSSYSSGPNRTTIVVEETVSNATVDGNVRYVSTTATFTVKEYVYFKRTTVLDPFVPVDPTPSNIAAYVVDQTNPTANTRLYRRESGRGGLNFLWKHVTPNFNLVDPAASNIIDMYVITRGYYSNLKNWIEGNTSIRPAVPTPLQLRTDYAPLLDNKMISDTVILHPGNFKILFGAHAIPQLQARIKVTRSANTNLTDNQIKVKVVSAVRQFFDINRWEFGETFFFTELAAAIHNALTIYISSVVLVPSYSSNYFGDLFEVACREDEVFIPDVTVNDIDIVASLNPVVLRQV